jgi:hypothetical protein
MCCYRHQLWLALVSCALAVLEGCDPFSEKFTGEFNAGSVDPADFPSPYRGANATRNVAGSGNGITAVRAYTDGGVIEYFRFPYGPSQVVTPGYVYTAQQISSQTQTATQISGLPVPRGYPFDPPGTGTPFPPQQSCAPPKGYTYDQRRDDVRYDEQGNIVTALPNAAFNPGSLPTWTYVPVVQEVPVTSNHETCQDIKSEKTLLARNDVSVGAPDGRYLAWALIDPGAAVYHVGETAAQSTGVGIQHWGWYQHFLVAYVEGGYVPVDGGTTFVTQNLYIPTQIRIDGGTAPAGQVGAGYDVLDYPRSDPSYSPICKVMLYGGANGVVVDRLPDGGPNLDQLPKSAADPRISDGGLRAPTSPAAGAIVPTGTVPPFIFCLQAQ